MRVVVEWGHYLRHIYNYALTKVNKISDCVITEISDHPNSFMACTIPTTISASLGTVLRNLGKFLASERRGDDDAGEI